MLAASRASRHGTCYLDACLAPLDGALRSRKRPRQSHVQISRTQPEAKGSLGSYLFGGVNLASKDPVRKHSVPPSRHHGDNQVISPTRHQKKLTKNKVIKALYQCDDVQLLQCDNVFPHSPILRVHVSGDGNGLILHSFFSSSHKAFNSHVRTRQRGDRPTPAVNSQCPKAADKHRPANYDWFAPSVLRTWC